MVVKTKAKGDYELNQDATSINVIYKIGQTKVYCSIVMRFNITTSYKLAKNILQIYKGSLICASLLVS